jgi:hypothetical protein
MTLDVFRAAALPRPREMRAQVLDELLHAIAVGREDGVRGVDLRIENNHLPAAAVGLEPARCAAPDRVHAVHLRAAPLAHHLRGV